MQNYENVSIDDLNLGARERLCLRRSNILTVGELISRKDTWGSVPNFGVKAQERVEESLQAFLNPPTQGEIASPAQSASLHQQLDEMIREKQSLEVRVKEMEIKLAELLPLEKFRFLKQEGERLRSLLDWEETIEVEALGNFHLKFSQFYGSSPILKLQFYPKEDFRTKDAPYSLDIDLFSSMLQPLHAAITEGQRIKQELQNIIERIGDTRDTILRLAAVLCVEEEES